MAGYTGAAGTNQGSWNGNGGGLGLTTTNRWAGNTAFGPAGGMATGYGTRDGVSLAGAGMAPSMGMYSNFNNMNGTPMFGGALGNQGFRAPNANAAYGMARSAYNQMQHPAPGPNPTGAPPLLATPMPPLQPPPALQPPMPPLGNIPFREHYGSPWSRSITMHDLYGTNYGPGVVSQTYGGKGDLGGQYPAGGKTNYGGPTSGGGFRSVGGKSNYGGY